MVARITAFRTRADLRLRRPRSISRNISPADGGAAVHWGGPRQANSTHARCEQTWRAWQNFHMAPGGLGAPNGAADIAYTAGFCDHGYVLAGRGFGARTGANGSAFGNGSFYAFAWIGGVGQVASQMALDALDWLIYEARTRHDAGRQVSPHSRFTASSCPGRQLREEAAKRHDRDIVLAPSSVAPWQGKRLRAIVAQVNFYDSPRWDRPTGQLLKGHHFPIVEGLHEAGSSRWYRVRDSDGDGPFFITTREDLVALVD